MTGDVARDAALDRLPLTYAVAIRMRHEGIADPVIARCLGIEPEAIGPLLRVADAKLAAAVERSRRGGR